MTTCAFDKSGSYFAAIGQDNILRVWNVSQSKITSTFSLENQTKFSCINWYTLQNETSTIKLAAGLGNGHIRVYDLVEDKLQCTLEGAHSCKISDLVFSGESMLYSIDYEGLVVQWNLDNASKVNQFSDRESSRVAISTDHTTVVTAGKNIRYWDVSSNSQSDQQKQFVDNNLFFIQNSSNNSNSSAKNDLLVGSNRIMYFIRDMQKAVTSTYVYRSDSIVKQIKVLPFTDKHITYYYCAIVTEANDILIHKNTDKNISNKTKLKFDGLVDLLSCHLVDINNVLIAQGQLSSPKSLSFKKIKIGEKGEPINTIVRVEFETKDKSVETENKVKKAVSAVGDAVELDLDTQVNVDLNSIDNNAKSAGTIVDVITQSLQSSNTITLFKALQCNTFVMRNTVQALPSPYAYMLLQMIVTNISQEYHRSHNLIQWINYIIKDHASYLLTIPGLRSKMQVLNSIVEDKYELHKSLTVLVGKFDLIEARGNSKSIRSVNYDPSLVYEDNSEDESEDEDMEDADDIDEVDLEDDSSDEDDEDNSDLDINPEDLMDDDLL